MWTNKTLKRTAQAGMASMLLLATPLVANFEGLRTTAYLDAVGVWTICYGETEGVKKGDTQTKENCGLMLRAKLGIFGLGVRYMVKQEMSPKTHAAFTSFAYNVGIGAFQKSTLLKLYNQKKKVEACNQLPRWNRAGGKVLKGLVTRREEEKKLCLQGLS